MTSIWQKAVQWYNDQKWDVLARHVYMAKRQCSDILYQMWDALARHIYMAKTVKGSAVVYVYQMLDVFARHIYMAQRQCSGIYQMWDVLARHIYMAKGSDIIRCETSFSRQVYVASKTKRQCSGLNVRCETSLLVTSTWLMSVQWYNEKAVQWYNYQMRVFIARHDYG